MSQIPDAQVTGPSWDDFPPGGVHASPNVRRAMECPYCENGILRSLGRDNDEVIEDCPRCVTENGIRVIEMADWARESSVFPDVDQMLQDLQYLDLGLSGFFDGLRREVAKQLHVPQHLLHA